MGCSQCKCNPCICKEVTPFAPAKVCQVCFDGLHCRGNLSPECECRCKELTKYGVIHTPEEWVEIRRNETEIRAAMCSVEGRFEDKMSDSGTTRLEGE